MTDRQVIILGLEDPVRAVLPPGWGVDCKCGPTGATPMLLLYDCPTPADGRLPEERIAVLALRYALRVVLYRWCGGLPPSIKDYPYEDPCMWEKTLSRVSELAGSQTSGRTPSRENSR